MIEGSAVRKKRRFLDMRELVVQKIPGGKVTDEMLKYAANMFSENYRTWGQQSPRYGQRVRAGPRILRNDYLLQNVAASYVRARVDGVLAGHALACTWNCEDKKVCWVTQLVVAEEYRGQGLAQTLLRALRADDIDIYGIASSHPYACRAAVKSFTGPTENISLQFVVQEAGRIMKASPIAYIRDAQLSGSLFHPEDDTGLVSGVNTNFFVDHIEPLEALHDLQENGLWSLGDLPEGHEFLVMLEKPYRRSRS
ncbi:hypothetical protein F5Y15DRAFT_173699 [Xylariaceae sp. FL0016]|nr:hypothetical protein F5Y15DRAFT_173699 [Xylariaceae sp. FL0016]